MTLAALLRDEGAAAARKRRGPSRQALEAAFRRDLQLPAYLSQVRLLPGVCKRRRCKSRFGVVRVSVDTRDRAMLDTLATVECAACGRTWRRTAAPKLGEYQSTRVTLILPGHERRWYNRGHWYREGDGSYVIADATWSQLMDACADWRKRNGRLLAARGRQADKKAAADAALHTQTVAALARWAERDAEQAADEAAAIARENA